MQNNLIEEPIVEMNNIKLSECEYCSKPIDILKRGNKYCSRECGYKGSSKRIPVSCECCSVIFEPARYSRLKGRGKFCSSKCWANINKKLDNRRWIREAYLKDKCDRCEFVPENRCQLDLDHIDGDSSNNKEENFQTLCANCHRLKTHIDNDGRWKNYYKSTTGKQADHFELS